MSAAAPAVGSAVAATQTCFFFFLFLVILSRLGTRPTYVRVIDKNWYDSGSIIPNNTLLKPTNEFKAVRQY